MAAVVSPEIWLHKLIGSMKAQGADANFVLAIEALLDDQVADTAYELIRET